MIEASTCRAAALLLISVFFLPIDANAEVTLENDRLRVVLDADGGLISSLVLKATGWDAAGDETASKWHGLAKDRLGTAPNNTIVREPFTWTDTSSTRVTGQAVLREGALAGTILAKTFSLEGDTLRVEVALTAGGASISKAGVHNYLPGVGVSDDTRFFYQLDGKVETYRRTGDVAIDSSGAAWYAITSSRGGLLATFETPKPANLYSYLGSQETSLEWYYPGVPAGQTLRYTYTLLPFSTDHPPTQLESALRDAGSDDGSGVAQHPVAHVPPLTTKRPVLSPRKSGYAFVSNIEQIAYVSAQTPSMIHFRPINPSYRPDLYLATPKGIEVYDGFRGITVSAAGTKTIRGKRFNVTKVAVKPNASKYTLIWQATATGWEEGKTLTGYFWGEWSEGAQKPQPLEIQAVDVPRVTPFETIPVWMSLPSDLIAIWPDTAALRDTGFNYMDLWTYTREGEEREQWGEHVLLESREWLKAADIKPIVWIREWWWHDGQRDAEGGRAMYIDGEWAEASLNLTYRGRYFQELIEQGKYLIDEGFYFHNTDPEIYRDGDKIDFSPATIAKFREYLAEHAPDLRYVSPIRFEKAPQEYPELHRHWNQFKAQCYVDFFVDYREAMEAYMKEKGIDAPFHFMAYTTYHRQWDGLYGYEDHRDSPVYTITLEDPAIMPQAFDYISPMVYTDVYANYNDYDMKLAWKDTIAIRRLIGDRATLAPILCAGYPFFDGFNSDLNAEMLKANILETVAGGGRGFGYWGECPIDAKDMKITAEAVGMLQPYERVILEGKPSDRVGSPTGNVFAKRIESPHGSLVLVSEYSETTLEATIACPVSEPSIVIDLNSGEQTASLTPGDHTFQVTLDDERAVMFYVGPKESP